MEVARLSGLEWRLYGAPIVGTVGKGPSLQTQAAPAGRLRAGSTRRAVATFASGDANSCGRVDGRSAPPGGAEPNGSPSGDGQRNWPCHPKDGRPLGQADGGGTAENSAPCYVAESGPGPTCADAVRRPGETANRVTRKCPVHGRARDASREPAAA